MNRVCSSDKSIAIYGLIAVFIAGITLRLYNIQVIPPFVDETGNILASVDAYFRNGLNANAWGRPFLEYLFQPATIIKDYGFADTLLMSARIQNSLVGVFSSCLLGLAFARLESIWIGVFIFILSILSPYLVFHDRLALQDSFQLFLIALILYFSSFITAKNKNSVTAILIYAFIGILIGVILCNKISGILSAAPLAALIIFYRNKDINYLRAILSCGFGFLFSFAVFCETWTSFGTYLPRHGHSSFLFAASDMQEMIITVLRNISLSQILLLSYQGSLLSLISICSLFFLLGTKHAWVTRICVASIILTALCYYNRLFGRYLIPDFYLVLLSSALFLNWLREKFGNYFACSLTLIAVIIGFYETRNFYHYDTQTEALYSFDGSHDFQQYTESAFSGQGLLKLIDWLDTNQFDKKSPLLFTTTLWTPVANGLALSKLDDSRIRAYQVPIFSEEGALLVSKFSRLKMRPRSIFLIPEEIHHFTLSGQKKLLRKFGYRVKLTRTLWRKDRARIGLFELTSWRLLPEVKKRFDFKYPDHIVGPHFRLENISSIEQSICLSRYPAITTPFTMTITDYHGTTEKLEGISSIIKIPITHFSFPISIAVRPFIFQRDKNNDYSSYDNNFRPVFGKLLNPADERCLSN